MSKFARFMKKNKILKANTTYAPTKSLLDENGEPVKFTIRPLSTREEGDIRDACTIDVPITGKPNMYRPRLNTTKYLAKTLCACIVDPDLHNKELQDSYGVMSPEELIKEMIDDPGEYQDFATFVQTYTGIDKSLEDEVEEAKN